MLFLCMYSHCNVWEQRSDLPISPYETFSSYLLWWWWGTANLYFSASAHPIVHRGSWEMLPVSSRTSVHFLSVPKDLISAEHPRQQTLAHLAPASLLSLVRLLSCSLSHKQSSNAVHSFLSEAALCLAFPPNWVAIPTHWFDWRHTLFISLTAACVSERARTNMLVIVHQVLGHHTRR